MYDYSHIEPVVHSGDIAQVVEHSTADREVPGSNPGVNFYDILRQTNGSEIDDTSNVRTINPF